MKRIRDRVDFDDRLEIWESVEEERREAEAALADARCEEALLQAAEVRGVEEVIHVLESYNR